MPGWASRECVQTGETPLNYLCAALGTPNENKISYHRGSERKAKWKGSSIHMPHSSRMSLDGSTASARRAGMADAAMPSSAIVSTAPPKTTGSIGFA